MTLDRALVARWQSDEGLRRADAVLAALAAGTSPDDAAWGRVDGRADLRGLRTPLPLRANRREVERFFVEDLSGLLVLRDTSLADLDLRGAQLESLRLFNVTLSNCVLDEARCQDWRIWGTRVTDSSFAGTDLRRAALGPWHEGRGNTFERVTFARADFRGASCTTATFVDCDFSQARLVKIDFQSSSFIRTRFAGELREVTFWDHGFKTGKPDANPMEDVDFSDAVFREVDFRRLNLDRVTFPTRPGHIVVRHYPCVLERAMATLDGDESLVGRLLRAVLGHRAKWVGPDQRVGVFSLSDFDEPGEAERVTELLAKLERECAGT